eukprot:TRINITY_DN2706_c0_g1_i3.p1 TRINITY_DN2706_c0_g1~~TRINITY_DN2706_c0_g1_i3.p1  ORF type:complete len:465 (-),score=67.42 TRINITY_DN2706_c0_g1_i3:26-1420(-)
MPVSSSEVHGSEFVVSPSPLKRCTQGGVRRYRVKAKCLLTAISVAPLLRLEVVQGLRVSDSVEQAANDSLTRDKSAQGNLVALTRSTAAQQGELSELRGEGWEHSDQAELEENNRQSTNEDMEGSESTTATVVHKQVPMVSPEMRSLLSEAINTQHERMLEVRNVKKLNVSKGELGLFKHSKAAANYSQNFRSSGLIFLRIQKTGTTTFANTATAQCSHFGVMKCDMYYHLDWNYVHSLVQLDPRRVIVTMLRNPVSRVISEATFLRKHGAYAEQIQWDYTPDILDRLQAWRDSNGSFAEFVSLPSNPANNREVRYILGFERPAMLCCNTKCKPRWDEFLSAGGIAPGNVIDDAIKNSGANILDVAKYRLEHDINFFGLTECYESSLLIANQALQWDPAITQSFSDKKPRSSGADYQGVTSDEATAITKKNEFDMALLGFAKRIMARRADAFGVKFDCDESRSR